MEKPWLTRYPAGVPESIDLADMSSLIDLIENTCRQYADKVAFQNFDVNLTYRAFDQIASDFAAYLQQNLKLERGTRVAIMMPNLLQFPVALFGILRAGMVVVNVNPLYTAREVVHQVNDAGCEAIIVLENFAHVVQEALPELKLKQVIVTQVGDLFPWYKRIASQIIVRYCKKDVKPWTIPQAILFREALSRGHGYKLNRVTLSHNDMAFLQYTGGTTGVAKGAVLTHGNMLANAYQIHAWINPFVNHETEVVITALPLYHIFSLTVNCLAFMMFGGQNVLITNPRDLTGFIKQLSRVQFSVITGVNTLFNAMLHHPKFSELDFSHLHITLGGGMAVQSAVAERWRDATGTPLIEGYGLTEASPVVSCYPLDAQGFNGSIGLPVPSTDICIQNDEGQVLAQGEVGELCVQGPQVMQGYWQKPDETAKVFTADGWLKTGDIAYIDENGFPHICERKKDMILVSGFNVYPNEVEAVIAELPQVLEVAVVGISHSTSGEIVKAFIVCDNKGLTVESVRAHCRTKLTNYKVPKRVEFRDSLPKSNVGKILRRELKNQ